MSVVVQMFGAGSLYSSPITNQRPDVLEAGGTLTDSSHQTGRGIGCYLSQQIIHLLRLGFSVTSVKASVSHFRRFSRLRLTSGDW